MTDSVAYSIRHHNRAKNIRIKVNGLGKVEVVAPNGVPDFVIHRFVRSQTEWIQHTLYKLKDERLEDSDLSYNTPEKVQLNAIQQLYTVDVNELCKINRVKEKANLLTINAVNRDHTNKLLRAWLQKKAKYYLIPWLNELALQHNISFNKVTIRGQKTRWGSCSSRGNISLNRNLLFLEVELVNYLILHELCHIIEPNHSQRFWDQVEIFEPNYRRLDKELSLAYKRVPLWAYSPT